jgi:hypothetical protein
MINKSKVRLFVLRQSQKTSTLPNSWPAYCIWFLIIKTYAMTTYQQKWLDILQNANLHGWEVKPTEDGIYVEMPNVTDLKLIRDILPETLAALSLDIDVPKSRLLFQFHNGYENFEYVLNPSDKDLTQE